MVIEYLKSIFINRLNKLRPLSIVPHLDLNLLIKFFINRNVIDQNKLSAEFTNCSNPKFWLSKTTWSIALIAKWSVSIQNGKKINIFIPDFFCNMSLYELKKTGINITYYNINEKLLPEITNLNNNLDLNYFNIFLFVHYFGNILDIQPTASFCKENKILLVEDAVHLMKPDLNIGKFSDFVLYSPYKHFPIPNGALIILNTNGPFFQTNDSKVIDIFYNEHQKIINTNNNNNVIIILWIIKRILQRLGVRRKFISNFEHEASLSIYDNPRISNLSLVILINLIPSLDSIITIKKNNSIAWKELFFDSMYNFHHDLEENQDAIPYLYGIIFSNTNIKDTFNFFQNCGIPVTTWPDLPNEVFLSENNYRVAHKLRFQKIYFPIHQSISTNKIIFYYKSLIEYSTRNWDIIEITNNEWDNYWPLIKNNNILQSSEYVQTKVECENWTAHKFLIIDHEQNPISIVHILKKKKPLLGEYIRINRGPLLIENNIKISKDILITASLILITKLSINRRWKFISIAPELKFSNENIAKLKLLGFLKRNTNSWASGLISLKETEEDLLMSLNGKWRNTLKKGIKNNIIIKKENENNLYKLLENYNKLKKTNKFSALSDTFIEKLSEKKGKFWKFNLITAFEANDFTFSNPIGMLVSVHSGDTSIYLIGTTNDIGRKLQANSVLLWSAILKAKREGLNYFDIGGLNKDTPKGIAEFKSGLNSEKYELIGEWIWQNYLN